MIAPVQSSLRLIKRERLGSFGTAVSNKEMIVSDSDYFFVIIMITNIYIFN